ncbi:Phospholipase OS=Stutzerimonas stutzeri OX=316 GN=CXK95_14165 PE=4 SV=1 [Stutzerimonas stutzeri]
MARQLADSFDQYWNHQLSVPIQHFFWRPPARHKLSEAREQLQQYLQQARRDDGPLYRRLIRYQREPQLQRWLDELIWAPAAALWDDPDKLLADGPPTQLLTTQLAPALTAVQDELMGWCRRTSCPPTAASTTCVERRRDGVTIRILTNSLEATDVPAVHGGYAPYRQRMLEQGVRLFELRRQPDQKSSYSFFGESESSLHSKAAVFDRQRVFIGSLNFDPRSVLWNSEVGILAQSPALAREVHRLTLEGMAPATSYEVKLARRGDTRQLVWIAEEQGQRIILEREPGGFWRRLNAWLADVVGLERML